MTNILETKVLLLKNLEYINSSYWLTWFVEYVNIWNDIILSWLIIIHDEEWVIELDIFWSKVKFNFWIRFYFESWHSVCTFVVNLFITNNIPKLFLKYSFIIIVLMIKNIFVLALLVSYITKTYQLLSYFVHY